MKKFTRILLLVFTMTLSILALPAFTGSAVSDQIVIHDPYVRAVPPGQPNSAVFMQLENQSDSDHVLVHATSPVSKVVELHTHRDEGGMKKMRRIEKIDIPARAKTSLQPGGLHVMLIDLYDELTLDQKISLTLEFEDGSKIPIIAPVRKIMMKGAMKPKPAM